ncbi:ABC transporter substrate-binding protein [Aquisalibacillus elongatus]|uniref:MarR-like DNA-binding transcriptional regulator SgrR of sgrS sRNA n=1 Tax=Aquisalibacillus elongatus TaxID=485577 RepID=A0A3N5B804_9BACI|nr:ABC transporter substrate-binding protein [Aquisalibacillus elongatus]RPF53447.1 MarR-like DNA-binding transcriptional regulator SgrR of sgrS sRNA [Aquisalibacillus elongatus]
MMKLKQHYFTFFQNYGAEPTEVYLDQLAKALQCSTRHTKSIIKQMQAENWIQWDPNPGRGNASTLTLLKKPTEIEEQQVQEWIKHGQISKALKWMEKQETLEESFVNWLENHFQWTPSTKHNEGLDVLSYPYYYPLHSLVPWESTTRHEGHIIEHIFNCLVKFDQETQTLAPELAHHWESKDNSRVWRIYLRKRLFFHNGKAITSSEIRDNVRIWKEKQLAAWKRQMIEQIQEINTPTSTLIEFKLEQPNPLFMQLFTGHKASIIPVSDYLEEPNKFRYHPIGSGPYLIKSHNQGHLILEAFQNYFGYRPLLDKVELYSIPKKPISPQRQIHYRIVNEDTLNVNKKDWFRPQLGGTFIAVNHQKSGIHQHPEFRKHLSYLLDRPKLFKHHPHHDVWFPDSMFDPQARPLRQHSNYEAAKKWFKDQGFIGKTLTLTSTCLKHDAYFKYELEVLKEVFEEVGINLETRVVDIFELSKEENLNQTDLVIAGFSLGDNPLVSLMNAYTSNTSFICNTIPDEARTHLNSLLDTVWKSSDTQSAYQNLREIEEFLLDEYFTIFLYQRKIHISVEADERLQGIEINLNNRLSYHKLWYKF